MEHPTDGNSKEAVWNLLGRNSKVGAELYNLYFGASDAKASIGNLYSDRNREKYLKKLAAGHSPAKPAPSNKPVPKSRAYVEVPPVKASPPPRPTALPAGGKKPLAAIQQELRHFEFPPLEPKGPLLDEDEKERLSLLNEYGGSLPEGLAALLTERWQARERGRGGGGGLAGAGQQQGSTQVQANLRKMFEELRNGIEVKMAAVRGAANEAEADKHRRDIKADLKHLRQLDAVLGKMESL